MLWSDFILGSKAPIMTAADNKFCDTFLNFEKKQQQEMIFHENRLRAKILMKYTLIVIFERATKFETVVCCKL